MEAHVLESRNMERANKGVSKLPEERTTERLHIIKNTDHRNETGHRNVLRKRQTCAYRRKILKTGILNEALVKIKKEREGNLP
jgi:hypothetical protein